jgi:hypothetical protein
MATANGATVCPGCRGQGMVMNYATKQQQVCPVCNGEGVKSPQPFRVPFDLVLPNAVLTASQLNVVITQQLDADADFEAIWIVSSQTGIFSVTLNDPSTGRNLSNAAVNSENYSGTAQLPFPLVEPYVFARATTLKAVFNDRSGGGNTIQLVLRGYKLFPRNAQMQGSQGAIVQA